MSKVAECQLSQWIRAGRWRGMLAGGVWIIGCLAFMVTGCGSDRPPLGEVSGTVTLDGQPVSRGIVHFVPQSGPAASGVIRDGDYSLWTFESSDGAVLGRHVVYFAPNPDESYLDGYTQEDYAAGRLPPDPPREELIPSRYFSPSSSGLVADVSPGFNQLDFQLTSRGE